MRERGTAAIELALGILVLLVPMALTVLSFGPMLERRNLVRALAPEAARTVILANGSVEPAVRLILADAAALGIGPDGVRVGVCGTTGRLLEVEGRCAVERGGHVEVTVEVPVPVLPWWPAGPSRVAYTHREPVEPYRSVP